MESNPISREILEERKKERKHIAVKSLKHTGKREREKKGKKKKVNAIKMSRPICQREKQHGEKKGREEEYSKLYKERIHFNVY